MKCIIMPLPMNERLHNALDAVALSVICLSLPPSFSLSLTRDRVTSRATNVWLFEQGSALRSRKIGATLNKCITMFDSRWELFAERSRRALWCLWTDEKEVELQSDATRNIFCPWILSSRTVLHHRSLIRAVCRSQESSGLRQVETRCVQRARPAVGSDTRKRSIDRPVDRSVSERNVGKYASIDGEISTRTYLESRPCAEARTHVTDRGFSDAYRTDFCRLSLISMGAAELREPVSASFHKSTGEWRIDWRCNRLSSATRGEDVRKNRGNISAIFAACHTYVGMSFVKFT